MRIFTFLVALLFAATNLHAQCTAYFQSTVSGNTASFYASNSGGMINNNTYVWDFGDNTTGTGANITHTYTNTTAATYTVCVTMTEASTGCTATYCAPININSGSSPTCNVNASFTYTQSPNGVSFASSISGFGPNVSYSWTFAAGTVGSTLANPTMQLANGTYTVCLTVSDGTCSDTYCATVTVGNTTNPCLGFTGSFTYTVSNGVVSFVGTGGNTASGGNYNYVWNFGNGASGTGATVTHNYANSTADSAWVCMTVSDPTNNCTYTYCDWVVFGNTTSNPCANLTAYFQYYTAPGGATHFWASNSGGILGGNGFIYNWSFGNGATASGAYVSHLFSGAPVLVTPNGSFYQACLTVTNPTNGCTATHCVYIALPSLTNANTGGPTTASGVFFNNNTTTPKPVEGNNLSFTTETELTLFPNPTNDVLNISIQSENINGNLLIINANGQNIYQENISFKDNTQITIPVKDLPTGIYFVQLLSNDIQKVVKFIKQ